MDWKTGKDSVFFCLHQEFRTVFPVFVFWIRPAGTIWKSGRLSCIGRSLNCNEKGIFRNAIDK